LENKNIVLFKKRCRTPYAEQCTAFEEYRRFDVTSAGHDPQFVKDLSPFFIGPVTASDGEVASTFESFWQYGKVYPLIYDADKKVVAGVDEKGDPTPAFWDWRKRFYASTTKKEVRHPAFPPKIHHRDCLYMVYFEEGKLKKLNYVESRKKIYIPEYAKLIVNTPSYKKLKEMVEKGEKIGLADFDCWNYYGKDLDLPVTMAQAVNDPNHKVGHSYVIKMLLQGDIEVVDGKVVDHVGILK